MISNKRVSLKPGKDAAIKRLHPWIFSGAIQDQSPDLADGDVVEIQNNRKEFLGIGHFHHGSIAVKILTFEPIDDLLTLWKERIHLALKRRKESIPPHTNAYRVVHGEGDLLPGLVIDYYHGVYVIQCHTIGMHRSIQDLASVLKALDPTCLGIYDKSQETLPAFYAKNVSNGYLHGHQTLPHVIEENGVKFQINWETGQKTGFFLDQRDNRALLGQYASGKKILNAFCYSGGFSLYALKAGAKAVVSIDASSKAITLLNENLHLNGLETSSHESVVGDVMKYIQDLSEDFDLMVLDPPAFAKSLNAKHHALQGYQRLNALAMRKIKSGGLIFTFSCSQVISRELFLNMLVAAGIQVGRKVQVLHQLSQGADHPINLFHPESHYLKGFVLRID